MQRPGPVVVYQRKSFGIGQADVSIELELAEKHGIGILKVKMPYEKIVQDGWKVTQKPTEIEFRIF